MGETRDHGLVLAIDAAGGVSALARGLRLAQPSVSGWKRIPAERVAAVAQLTGIERHRLRPDLFAYSTMTQQSQGLGSAPIDPTERARAEEYLLLAALLSRPPEQRLLDIVAAIKGDASPLGMAHIELARAAAAVTETAAGEEFFTLFIGIGRGEVLPYASYYLTGFLHERPLARVREDLQRLGIERQEGVYEPEDRLATLLEVMAGLIAGTFDAGTLNNGMGRSLDEQKQFFTRHIEPWAARCFADIAVSPSARFYKAVANVGLRWIEIEAEAFQLPM